MRVSACLRVRTYVDALRERTHMLERCAHGLATGHVAHHGDAAAAARWPGERDLHCTRATYAIVDRAPRVR